jgi:hypothetical protein
MAVVLVKNDKGVFEEVPYFVTEGGGGTGGGGASASYEEVFNYSTLGTFGGCSTTTEQAQKLADASEIYMQVSVGYIQNAPSDFKLKLKFGFANLYELAVDRIYERSASSESTGPQWFVKLTKLPRNKYVVDDCFYTEYYDEATMSNPIKSIESRKFLGSNNMASGDVPYFGVSVHLNSDTETAATIPGGAAVTIWAR